VVIKKVVHKPLNNFYTKQFCVVDHVPGSTQQSWCHCDYTQTHAHARARTRARARTHTHTHTMHPQTV